MAERQSVVATYSAYADVEDAVVALHRSGYNITRLSILHAGSRIEERIVGFFSEAQRVKYWGRYGAIFGGIMGLVAGAALFYAHSVTAELVITLMAVTLGGALLIGLLVAAGAVVYGKVLTVDVPLGCASHVEGKDLFSLVSHDEELAARARELLLRPDLPGRHEGEAPESEVGAGSSSGAARLVFARRLARLRRRRRSG